MPLALRGERGLVRIKDQAVVHADHLYASARA